MTDNNNLQEVFWTRPMIILPNVSGLSSAESFREMEWLQDKIVAHYEKIILGLLAIAPELEEDRCCQTEVRITRKQPLSASCRMDEG